MKTLAEELEQEGVPHAIEGDALQAHLTVEPEDLAGAAEVLARSEHVAALSDFFASDTGDGVELTYRLRLSDLASDVLLRCAMSYSTPLESLWTAFPAVLMCEREVAELFGLRLSEHPNPVRLLTMAGAEPMMRHSVALRHEDDYAAGEEPWQTETDAATPGVASRAGRRGVSLEGKRSERPHRAAPIGLTHVPAGAGTGHSRRGLIRLAPRFDPGSDAPGLTLRVVGESVLAAEADMGFAHRGIERLSQERHLMELGGLLARLDRSASVHAQHAAALAIERTVHVEASPKGAWLRCLYAELARVAGHLGWLQGFVSDAGLRSLSERAARNRQAFLGIGEQLAGDAGAGYVLPGGVSADMPAALDSSITELCDAFEPDLERIGRKVLGSGLLRRRLHGLAAFGAQTARALAVTGPSLRACGMVCDVRRDMPYDAYAELEFEVPIGSVGDAWDRMSVRIEEMRQSVAMIRQLVAGLPEGACRTQADSPWRASPGEAYAAVESGRGELGVHLVTTGARKPQRVRLRTPSLFACQLAEEILPGTELSDVFLVLGSLDIGLGEAER